MPAKIHTSLHTQVLTHTNTPSSIHVDTAMSTAGTPTGSRVVTTHTPYPTQKLALSWRYSHTSPTHSMSHTCTHTHVHSHHADTNAHQVTEALQIPHGITCHSHVCTHPLLGPHLPPLWVPCPPLSFLFCLLLPGVPQGGHVCCWRGLESGRLLTHPPGAVPSMAPLAPEATSPTVAVGDPSARGSWAGAEPCAPWLGHSQAHGSASRKGRR